MTHKFKQIQRCQRRPYCLIKNKKVYPGDFVNVTHALYHGIRRVLDISTNPGYVTCVLILTNLGKEMWLERAYCTKYTGDTPDPRTIGNGDVTTLDTKVEIHDGVSWKGPYQVTALYVTPGARGHLVYKHAGHQMPHHVFGGNFRKYTGDPDDAYL